MFAAALTAFFFACSAVTGQRVALRLGGVWANLWRLAVATLVLGLVVLVFLPGTIQAAALPWYFLSGLIGFGIGDVALFLAYERLGSRLTILLNLCLAPLFAMGQEWLWLGHSVGWRVGLCALLILGGVVLALHPGTSHRQKLERRGSFAWGVVAALVAGWGQGTGAVISRKAEAVLVAAGGTSSGISAAFQRVSAGLVFALLSVLVIRCFFPPTARANWRSPLDRKIVPWLLGAALFGPVIGVSCFQWALQSLESGIVLAVVATTPIIMMPLAYLTEGDRPARLALLGAVMAVLGVALLSLWA